jgi:hypothetical protein
VINENLPNLLGAVPIIGGAGGICVDFDDRLLRRRKLIDGRTSVVYAANQAVRRSILRIIGAARNHRSRRWCVYGNRAVGARRDHSTRIA